MKLVAALLGSSFRGKVFQNARVLFLSFLLLGNLIFINFHSLISCEFPSSSFKTIFCSSLGQTFLTHCVKDKVLAGLHSFL